MKSELSSIVAKLDDENQFFIYFSNALASKMNGFHIMDNVDGLIFPENWEEL